MSRFWRTVRVFISSTFRDMQAERDHLVRFVFPRLREQLRAHRIHLVDVDLRWGVTSEQDALEVCREVIDECQWFLCMLGGRYGWTPPGLEMSITEAEIRYAALDAVGQPKYCLFFFRDPQATAAMSDEIARADGFREFASLNEIEKYGLRQANCMAQFRAQKLAELKAAIGRAGFDPVIYPAQWNAQQRRMVGLETFGNRIYTDLLSSIERELGSSPPGEVTEFTAENAAMDAFVENRVRYYVIGSRQPLLAQLMAFCQARGDPNLLEVIGAPGSGKSALLAKFHLDYTQQHPNDIVIAHFIGASRNSTELRSMLRRLCHELSVQAGLPDPVPQEISELRQAFPAFLHKAASRQRVVILLDALNQLEARDHAHTLQWMPEDLPANVRVIYSSVEHPALEAARRRWPRCQRVICGPLAQSDIAAIIDRFLGRYRKRFDQEQSHALKHKAESHSPLYLLAALEEIRTLGTYEEITARIHSLPGTTMALFDWILRRLERGVEGQKAFGTELVSAYTAYIAIGRGGMAETELEALCRPVDTENEFQFLQRMLRPYLVVRGELVTFFHGQLQEAVIARYLGSSSRHRRHREVAHHLQQRGCGYLRTLSELAYHHYQAALESGDFRYLFALIDDAGFRQRQFECFGRPEPVVEGIDYAIDLSVRQHALVSLIHFTMMRIEVAAQIFSKDLFRLVTIAHDEPHHAHEIINFIPSLTVRRIALLLLAWRLVQDQHEPGFVRDLIAEAADIAPPASVNQVPVLLEIIQELHRAGFDEVTCLMIALPDCPVRRAYQTAWASAPGHVRMLSLEMQRTASLVPAASAEEIRDFDKTQEFITKRGNVQRRATQPEEFEARIFELLGPSKVADVYCLLAAEWMHTGHANTAAMLLNRGIYVSSEFLPAPIRTLAALTELLQKAGNHDLAQEHAARVRTVTGGIRRMASAEYNSGRFQDALSDFVMALHNAAGVWQPPVLSSFRERSLAGQRLPGIAEDPDPLDRLARIRQLVAREQVGTVPDLLLQLLNDPDLDHAIVVSLYAVARACREDILAATCAARLQPNHLDPAAIYHPGDSNDAALVVLETIAASDPRCAATFSLCLRLEGLDDRLLELVQVASRAGAGVATLDAILSQVMRATAPAPEGLRQIGDEIIGTTLSTLMIPSGFGWYFFPGTMLWTAWSGIMLASTGFQAAAADLHLAASGLLFMLAGLIGSGVDLWIWRVIGVWERPEISRGLLPELGSLVCIWLPAWPARRWLADMDRAGMGVGLLGAAVWSLLIGVIFWRKAWLFAPLSARFMTIGTALALSLAAILGVLVPLLAADRVPMAVWGGAFLIGMLELSTGLNILPKHIAVHRYYAANNAAPESICS